MFKYAFSLLISIRFGVKDSKINKLSHQIKTNLAEIYQILTFEFLYSYTFPLSGTPVKFLPV